MDIIAFYRRSLRWFVYWILFLGTVLAITLFWRRMANGFPVMSWQLPLVMLIFVGVSALLRGAVYIAFKNESKTCQRIGLFLVPVELLLLTGVCRTEALPEFYLTVIIAFLFHYVFWFWSYDESCSNASVSIENRIEQPDESDKDLELYMTSEDEESEEDDFEALYPADVYQQWTRQIGSEGEDIQTGWFRVSFAAQQRRACVNAAFCPPFEAVPETELEIIDGAELAATVSACYPHGARIELKLSVPSPLEQTALIRFTAKCEK